MDKEKGRSGIENVLVDSTFADYRGVQNSPYGHALGYHNRKGMFERLEISLL